ncbi:MAG: AtpZ/AtpI family protein [Alphaproteobacteria bacterium]|nr:AtpZ/AtpI family protein [Alphaproteobacteria bacterium]
MPYDKINTQDTEQKLIRKAQKMAYRDQRPFYLNIGIIGVFAGHIIVPLLLGVWFGGWLDKHYPHETISWRMNMILVGLIIGYTDACFWVRREGILKINADYDKEQEALQKAEQKEEK